MTKNDHKFITVELQSSPCNDVREAKLYSNVFAQSAFDNEVTLEEFKYSLDKFSQSSRSSFPQIQAWRDEATEIFFGLLEKAGKLRMQPDEFLGGSDYEEVNGTTPDNENK